MHQSMRRPIFLPMSHINRRALMSTWKKGQHNLLQSLPFSHQSCTCGGLLHTLGGGRRRGNVIIIISLMTLWCAISQVIWPQHLLASWQYEVRSILHTRNTRFVWNSGQNTSIYVFWFRTFCNSLKNLHSCGSTHFDKEEFFSVTFVA